MKQYVKLVFPLALLLVLVLLFVSIGTASGADNDCDKYLSNISKERPLDQYPHLEQYHRCVYGISENDMLISDDGLYPISAQGIYFIGAGFITPIENDDGIDVAAAVLPAVCYPTMPSTPCSMSAEDVNVELIGIDETWQPYFIASRPQFDDTWVSGETVSDDGDNFITILFLSDVRDYTLMYVRLLQRGQPDLFVEVEVLR